jgi:hypothetical protein
MKVLLFSWDILFLSFIIALGYFLLVVFSFSFTFLYHIFPKIFLNFSSLPRPSLCLRVCRSVLSTINEESLDLKAREGVMSNERLGHELLSSLYPVVEPGLSDSGSLDCCLEFLVAAGNRSLPEAVMTMIPEAWQNDPAMAEDRKAWVYVLGGVGTGVFNAPNYETKRDGNRNCGR